MLMHLNSCWCLVKTDVPNGNVEVLCKVFKWSVESVGPMSGAHGLGWLAPHNALASPAINFSCRQK